MFSGQELPGIVGLIRREQTPDEKIFSENPVIISCNLDQKSRFIRCKMANGNADIPDFVQIKIITFDSYAVALLGEGNHSEVVD